jgi:DNA primase
MESDLLTLVEQDGFRAARRSTSRGGQYNGPCPFEGCGGTDRFRVQPHYGPYAWFVCNQCGRKGSAIDYLMDKRGLSKQEALAIVGWKPNDGKRASCLLPKQAQDERPRWHEPPEQWQAAAPPFYQACQRTLWSPRGQAALDYLKRRGLTERIIKAACIGYHAGETYGLAREWGRAVKLPQGIVFPWFFQGQLWRVTIRDERVAAGAGRYTQIAGVR